MSKAHKINSVKQHRATNGASFQSPKRKPDDWQKLASAQGVEPISDYQRFLGEVGSTWPKEESLDDFLGWLEKERLEGPEEK